MDIQIQADYGRRNEKMKRLTGLLLALCIGFGLLTGSISAAAENEWQEAYRGLLDEMVRERDPQYRNDVAIESSYLLYDVDKDGTPELIMKTGTCEADYQGTLYTCRDGAAVKVDEFGLGHSSLYSDPGENGIILHNGHMGYAFGARFSLVDGQLAYEDIFEDNLNSRLQEDEDAEYIPVEHFVPGACYLTLCDAELDLPIVHYEEIRQALDGEFPKAAELTWPNGDEEFYEACDKYGYKLQKAFALINSKGKPSGHSTIVVTGYGPGYHPEIRKNLNSKPGAMYYIHFDLTLDAQLKDAKDYAEGVAKGVAMLEVMNSVDGDKLPGVL